MVATPSRARQSTLRAEHERERILHRDILGQKAIRMCPLEEGAVGGELTRFAQELWQMPNMNGYFDRAHLSNMREHRHEAEHGFATLPGGGILEILSIPSMPEQVMGFHLFTVFDPTDDGDRGRAIGYTIWSLERGHASFGHAEAVRMAFDIFPPYREHRYRKVVFTNHDIYNISRRLLYRHKPQRFLVDARSQISETRTGRSLKRAIYYLKRGYYPPDQKPLADSCLDRLVRSQPVSPRTLRRLLRLSQSIFWVFPIEQYLQ
ncbi:MAG: hypothetical protein NTW21_13490 [Verrucomicrobia bacterium]|nr:hypothetical protein [Verrucomicrobiota bacterium]